MIGKKIGNYWAGRTVGMRKHKAFQEGVANWMRKTFAPEVITDLRERNHRFIEEAIELVQACGCTKEEVLILVNYVYNRPVGEPVQEVGGVSVTLAALCNARDIDMVDASQTELTRIWECIETIRSKQAAKASIFKKL